MCFLRVYEKQSVGFPELLGLVMSILRTSKPWVPRSNRGSRTNEYTASEVRERFLFYKSVQR